MNTLDMPVPENFNAPVLKSIPYKLLSFVCKIGGEKIFQVSYAKLGCAKNGKNTTTTKTFLSLCKIGDFP